jgi:hypothetical protein
LDDSEPEKPLIWCDFLGTYTTEGLCVLAAANDPNADPPPNACMDGSIRIQCADLVDAQNKGGAETDPRGAAKTTWQYLKSIWAECLNDFT